MADSKFFPYSFYVPERDDALLRFVEAQSNLSMSIRLLIKAFIAGNGTPETDVTMMDLNQLIRSMRLDAGIFDPEPSRRGRPRKNAALPVQEAPAAPQAFGPEPGAEPEEQPAPAPEAAYEPPEETRPVPASAPEPVHEQPAPEAPQEPEPPAEPAGADEDPVDGPQVEVEPERPKKLLDSSRARYNAELRPGEEASMDDIMGMMGEGF